MMVRLRKIRAGMKRGILGGRFRQQRPPSPSSGVSDEASCAAIQHVYCWRNEEGGRKTEIEGEKTCDRNSAGLLLMDARHSLRSAIHASSHGCQRDESLLEDGKEMEPGLRWGNELTPVLHHLPPPLPAIFIYLCFFPGPLPPSGS